MADMGGQLGGLRIIDDQPDGANRIHFSTYPDDIRSSSAERIVYRAWGRNAAGLASGDPPYSAIRASDDPLARAGVHRFSTADASFLYSFPAVDEAGLKRGTALFSVPLSALETRLSRSGRTGFMERLVPVGDGGFVLRLPADGAESLSP
jgi:hypothetical protein